jgi:HEPN domain-containing protein
MSDDAPREWMAYAEENLQMAKLAMGSNLLNPSLQNAQQAIEKALKAVWVSTGKSVRKTHSIADLVEGLGSIGIDARLSEDECNLLDSIYLPSKYPAQSVLPEGMPDARIAKRCMEIADRVCEWANAHLGII